MWTSPDRRPGALPRLLIPAAGLEPPGLPGGGSSVGVLLRDLDLAALVGAAELDRELLAVDLDSVEGLDSDLAAVGFVVRRLGIGIVMTRRPALAAGAAELGALGLLHVFAFDSTGLGRSLEGHPRAPGVGTVVSPGPALGHLSPGDLGRLPRPLVAYGLIETPDRARALLAQADSIVVHRDCAAALLAEGAAPLPAP